VTPNEFAELIRKLPKEVGDRPMLLEQESSGALLDVKTVKVDGEALVLSPTSSSSTGDCFDYGKGREKT
jgi:hypothetical protein